MLRFDEVEGDHVCEGDARKSGHGFLKSVYYETYCGLNFEAYLIRLAACEKEIVVKTGHIINYAADQIISCAPYVGEGRLD